MAVYARGYRPYEGEFKLRSPAIPIFGEGILSIVRTRSFKFIGLLTFLTYIIQAIRLYFLLNIKENTALLMNGGEAFEFAAQTERYLYDAMSAFYNGAVVFGALITMFAGAGLVADDLRTRALPLYLVRPIRPIDYLLGKALVIPGLLALVLLLPGASLYLMAGLWQPDGTTSAFLWEYKGLLALAFEVWLIASLSFAGVMLFFSCRTERRGAVTGIAAAVFFGGTVLAALGMPMRGSIGALFRHASVIMNSMSPMLRYEPSVSGMFGGKRDMATVIERTPGPTAALIIAAVLLLIGGYGVYRRARTTEIVG